MKKRIVALIALVYEIVRKRDHWIKKIEFIRGLYRYPGRMLGRKIYGEWNSSTDILVIAAHQDDDVLGLGTTLYRHNKKGDRIKVIFVTNGTGRGGESWNSKISSTVKKSEIRHNEATEALSLINIPEENIFCLGYPDGGTHRYLNCLYQDIDLFIQKMKPGRIYVHCIEGGHRDHDLTSYVVKSVCKQLGYSQLFEWTEYNPSQPLGTHKVQFLPLESKRLDEIGINISKTERLLKKRMLALHQSQDVEQFFQQGEAIRPAKMINVENELFLHSQFSKEKLTSIVESFNKWVYTTNKKSKKEETYYDSKENIAK